jgi:hypothetical protein
VELEKDRRDQRNVWHYVANAFSLCVDRIAPGAPPLGSPPVVHTGFDPLQSMPTPVKAKFDPRVLQRQVTWNVAYGIPVYLQVPIYPIMRQRQSTFLGQCRGRVRLAYRNQSVSGDGRAVYFHDWRET